MECAERKTESARSVEVGKPSYDDPSHGTEHARQKQLRHPSDVGDFAVEQHNREYDRGDGNHSYTGCEPADFEMAETG